MSEAVVSEVDAPSVSDVQGPEIPDAYVVPVAAMNEIVGYLLNQPWREVDRLLRAIDGIRTFDEYVEA